MTRTRDRRKDLKLPGFRKEGETGVLRVREGRKEIKQ